MKNILNKIKESTSAKILIAIIIILITGLILLFFDDKGKDKTNISPTNIPNKTVESKISNSTIQIPENFNFNEEQSALSTELQGNKQIISNPSKTITIVINTINKNSSNDFSTGGSTVLRPDNTFLDKMKFITTLDGNNLYMEDPSTKYVLASNGSGSYLTLDKRIEFHLFKLLNLNAKSYTSEFKSSKNQDISITVYFSLVPKTDFDTNVSLVEKILKTILI